MTSNPYARLDPDQLALLRHVVAEACESDEDMGVILERMTATPADKRAVSDAITEARR